LVPGSLFWIIISKICNFREAAVYAHCFEKIGLVKKLKEIQQFCPIFLIFIFLKIPVLLAKVTFSGLLVGDDFSQEQ
jgi:hypothetical protein